MGADVLGLCSYRVRYAQPAPRPHTRHAGTLQRLPTNQPDRVEREKPRMMTASDYEPRAWVGCLSCYNSGTLRGEWLDVGGLEDAETLEQVCADPSHEELWVMDHENMATSGEMSPAEAAKRARAITELIADCDDYGLPVPVALEYLEALGYHDPEQWPRIGLDVSYTSAEDETDYVCMILEGWMNYRDLPVWLSIDYAGTFSDLTSGLTVIRHEGALYIFHE